MKKKFWNQIEIYEATDIMKNVTMLKLLPIYNTIRVQFKIYQYLNNCSSYHGMGHRVTYALDNFNYVRSLSFLFSHFSTPLLNFEHTHI